jgi:hypothetical protein
VFVYLEIDVEVFYSLTNSHAIFLTSQNYKFDEMTHLSLNIERNTKLKFHLSYHKHVTASPSDHSAPEKIPSLQHISSPNSEADLQATP